MSYNWINAKDYTMNCFLLFDRWALKWIFTDCSANEWFSYGDRDYKLDMAMALYRYPHVEWYVRNKAPECTEFLDEIKKIPYGNWTEDEMKEAESAILQAHETFVVYAFPEVMNQVNYIRNWDEKYLYELVDLTDKILLDVGSGTGRLAFAAAKKAKRVYASEPCDCLREYMRDRIKAEEISNVKVLDGEVLSLPYENDTFDVVLSGHVIGDFYEEEIAEITRITKDGGWLVICNGDDEFKRTGPDSELTSRGFEWLSHESIEGGIIYDYRKQVRKEV
ncbi:Methyltransferase domain-containing protein [Butyrivibrio sp. ob235]|uniref:class I SAM-dependent methyltransferase n=1 Tax=Butyrivibrio sp. ob235 TaxID=1761780 RepID=UPI0008B7864F|nr:class I SAM-dependent methyltransferase [Butyrivibrio sp. ob235]SEM36907.1 Methyltransferase domain-containing protein [Butyrivibrio sp. ob235]